MAWEIAAFLALPSLPPGPRRPPRLLLAPLFRSFHRRPRSNPPNIHPHESEKVRRLVPLPLISQLLFTALFPTIRLVQVPVALDYQSSRMPLNGDGLLAPAVPLNFLPTILEPDFFLPLRKGRAFLYITLGRDSRSFTSFQFCELLLPPVDKRSTQVPRGDPSGTGTPLQLVRTSLRPASPPPVSFALSLAGRVARRKNTGCS